MKKRTISIALIFAMALGMMGMPAYALSGVIVVLDGKTLAFEVAPQIINSRTMVPLRAIFEAMGAKVEWDGATQTVTATKDSTVVILKIGSTSPTVNGKVVAIDQPGVIVNGRTLAPLRFVAEAFGGEVMWDGATQTVSITMPGTASNQVPASELASMPTHGLLNIIAPTPSGGLGAIMVDSVKMNGCIYNNAIRYFVLYKNNVSIHKLNGQYTKVFGYFGHEDGSTEYNANVFIYGDDKLLSSYTLSYDEAPTYIVIDVTGINTLRIVAKYVGNSYYTTDNPTYCFAEVYVE